VACKTNKSPKASEAASPRTEHGPSSDSSFGTVQASRSPHRRSACLDGFRSARFRRRTASERRRDGRSARAQSRPSTRSYSPKRLSAASRDRHLTVYPFLLAHTAAACRDMAPCGVLGYQADSERLWRRRRVFATNGLMAVREGVDRTLLKGVIPVAVAGMAAGVGGALVASRR